jgi:hypothetical protein
VGTFDAPGIKILEQFGIGQALATSYTIVLHIALWLPVTLLGAYYMLRESVSWGDIQQAAQIKDESTPETLATAVAAEQPHDARESDRDDRTRGATL